MKRKLLLLPTLFVTTIPLVGIVSCNSSVKIDFFDNNSESYGIPSLASQEFETKLNTTYKLKMNISQCVGDSLDYYDVSYIKIVKVSDGNRTTAEFEVLKYICDGRKLQLTQPLDNGNDTYYYQTITSPDGVNVKASYKESLKKDSYLEIYLKFKTLEPTGNVKVEFYNCT